MCGHTHGIQAQRSAALFMVMRLRLRQFMRLISGFV
jgi:hypothetical protein